MIFAPTKMSAYSCSHKKTKSNTWLWGPDNDEHAVFKDLRIGNFDDIFEIKSSLSNKYTGVPISLSRVSRAINKIKCKIMTTIIYSLRVHNGTIKICFNFQTKIIGLC